VDDSSRATSAGCAPTNVAVALLLAPVGSEVALLTVAVLAIWPN